MCSKSVRSTDNINDLPDVVLEFILSHLSQYKDAFDCRLVCKRWNQAIAVSSEKNERDFHGSLTTNNLFWSSYPPLNGPAISSRFSHSACRIGANMYIFGGLASSNTTFNDLWGFNLVSRSWKRLVTSGVYPPPKSCATLLPYEKRLILYGGWTCWAVSRSPMQEGWKSFNNIHEYDCRLNLWSLIETKNEGPALSGHSASIVCDLMIVFGGLSPENNNTGFHPSNDLWVYNLKTKAWASQTTLTQKPPPRYGHSQIVLDSKHLLIMGGCGGPNMLLNDVWMLTIIDAPTPGWHWKQVMMQTSDKSCQPAIGLHQACKIGNKVFVLNKSPVAKPIKRATRIDNSQASCYSPQSSEDCTTDAHSTCNGPSVRPNARCNDKDFWRV